MCWRNVRMLAYNTRFLCCHGSKPLHRNYRELLST